MKVCNTCKIEKELTEFHRNKKHKDGLHYHCKSCQAEYKRKWNKDNKKSKAKYQLRWEKENKEIRRSIRKKYRKTDRGKALHCEQSQRRRANKLNSLASLTELEKLEIEIMYEEVSMLGKGWHVDHIVPLSKGGLHHPDNLQIVSSMYNVRKSDRIFNERKYK